MKSILNLTRNPKNEIYLDNDGSSFNVTRIFLNDTDNIIERGEVYIEEDATTEYARILEIINSTQIITERLNNTFTSLAICTIHASDNLAPGVPEVVTGANEVKIFPSWNLSKYQNGTRDDLKEIKDNQNVMETFNNFYTEGVLLERDVSNPGYIKIYSDSDRPIIFCNPNNIFYDTSSISLDVSTILDPSTGYLENQFIDIYIEDSGVTPLLVNTYRIKLIGKGSGSSAYTSSASSGQYLIGCVYLQNGKIIGINNLFNINNNMISYINESAYGVSISNTSYTYGSTFYFPVFKEGIVYFNFRFQTNSGTNICDSWNYEIAIFDDTEMLGQTRIRTLTLPVTTRDGRNPLHIETWKHVESSKVMQIKFGGKRGADDVSPSTPVGLTVVLGDIEFDNNVLIQPNSGKEVFPTYSINNYYNYPFGLPYHICEYNGYIYVSEDHTGYTRLHEFNSSDGSLSQRWQEYYSSKSLYKMIVFDNRLFVGCESATSNILQVYDGTNWSTTYHNMCNRGYSLDTYQGKIYMSGNDQAGHEGLISSNTGNTGDWVIASANYSDFGSDDYAYSMEVFNNYLLLGQKFGRIYTWDGSSAVLRATFTVESKVREIETFNNVVVATTEDNQMMYSLNGEDWDTIQTPNMDYCYCLLSIGEYLLACGGDSPNIPKVFYTKNLNTWTEIEIDATVLANAQGYFRSMIYYDNKLWLICNGSKSLLTWGSFSC